ncbi:MAG: hypothetical protein ABIA04_11815 [Pseudomonadota bacterium]
MRYKAISLLSGGLDSIIATKVIMEQGIEVLALNLVSPFCTCTSSSSGCLNIAKKAADDLGIEIKFVNKGLEYVKLVENPKMGYGKALNPCQDCRVFAFKVAKDVMDSEKAQFIITGEVLGQRPMSQRKDALFRIENASGLKGYIVRPLSAKLLPPTIPEKEGIIDRNKLLDIAGRSRRQQLDWADNFQIKDFACAGGGCKLTEKLFAKKLKDVFENDPAYDMSDIILLNIGRHFRIAKNTKVIIGKDEKENRRLVAYAKASEKYNYLEAVDYPAPSALITNGKNEEAMEIAKKLISEYAKFNEEKLSEIKFKDKDEDIIVIRVAEAGFEIDRYRVV